jgi:hypothetical protein
VIPSHLLQQEPPRWRRYLDFPSAEISDSTIYFLPLYCDLKEVSAVVTPRRNQASTISEHFCGGLLIQEVKQFQPGGRKTFARVGAIRRIEQDKLPESMMPRFEELKSKKPEDFGEEIVLI